MKITILGSGSFVPSYKRHSSSYLLGLKNERIVFDFGRGAVDSLLRLGVDWTNLDRVFLTHIHLDHVSDLLPFLQIALHAAPELGVRKKDLTIYGPKGFKQFYKYLSKASHELLIPDDLSFKVNLIELGDGQEVQINDTLIKCFKVEHTPKLKSLAYRVEEGDKNLFYSGDINSEPDNFKGMVNADVAILEANRILKPIPVHITITEAAANATKYRVKRLVLTHLSELVLKDYDVESEAKKYFKGEVIVAEDLKEIKI